MDEYIRKVKIVAFDEIDKVLNGNWDSERKLAAIDGIMAETCGVITAVVIEQMKG